MEAPGKVTLLEEELQKINQTLRSRMHEPS
ncbi:hypothetical protein SBA3_1220014 [Candidatus Sulfopaludibacter sp. SbA3]|nr:hypothetical protein SBA3_1220014 [Candidatus Sulfopaludibacter sp. SbA3]